MNINDIAVDIRLTNKGKMVGVALIKYKNPEEDGFRLSGFKILVGQYPTNYTDKNGNFLWLAAPSYADPVTGKLINTFFTAPDLWEQIERKVIGHYLEKEAVF